MALIYRKKEYPINATNAKILRTNFDNNVPYYGSFNPAFRLYLKANYKSLNENEIEQIINLI